MAREAQDAWTHWGERDPLYAVMSEPGKQDNRWDAEEFYASGRSDVERVREWLAASGLTLGGKEALDFGCGPGRLTQALAVHFEHVTGVDVSVPMLELARANNRRGARVTYVHNASSAIPDVPAASMEFGLSLITLQHIPTRHQKRFLASLLSKLSPGGLFVVQVPDRRVKVAGDSWRAHLVRFGYATGPWFPGALYAFLRRRHPGLVEMHPFPRRALLRTVRRAGCELVAETEDEGARPHFVSKRYLIRRMPG